MKFGDDYLMWQDLLITHVYGTDNAQRPVYLDIEDLLLSTIAEEIRGEPTPPAESEQLLVQSVTPTLYLDNVHEGTSVLSAHVTRNRTWRRERTRSGYDPELDPPPSIPLLAVFARAAEVMGKDKELGKNNYYGRLDAILQVPPSERGRLHASFMTYSEPLWSNLNLWLEDLEGERGLPTARAIGHRYVGLPMSQALLRAVDREKFAHLFDDLDLTPGQIVDPEDMVSYLDAWLKDGTIGAKGGLTHLQRIWKTKAGKQVLSQAAATELQLWDGVLPAGAKPKNRAPLVLARLTRAGGLGKERLSLAVALRRSEQHELNTALSWTIESAPDLNAPHVRFEPLTDRYLAPDRPLESLDASSLLDGALVLGRADTDVQLIRHPRPLVVLLSLDGQGSTYIEVSSAQLGLLHLVLVNESAINPAGHSILGPGGPKSIEKVLDQIAQPGFVRLTSEQLPGLPDGWAAYKNVVIVSTLEKPNLLLAPLQATQSRVLSVTGGLRVPGAAHRWSCLSPFTVMGLSPGSTHVGVDLVRVNEDDEEGEVLQHWESDDESLLGSEHVTASPGLYALRLFDSRGTKGPSRRFNFALVSADEPRALASPIDVAHRAGSECILPAEVSACAGDPNRADKGTLVVAGPETYWQPPSSDEHVVVPDHVWWQANEAPVKVRKIGRFEKNSCAQTGAHHEKIERHHKGDRYNKSVCIKCGLVRWYRPKAPLKKNASSTPSKSSGVGHLPVYAQSSVPGEAVMDVLAWMEGGRPQDLEGVLRQVADTALNVRELANLLSDMAHVDLARDENFTVSGWAMVRPSLAQSAVGDWLLVGKWGTTLINTLKARAEETGFEWYESKEDFLPVRSVRGSHGDIARLVEGLGIELVPAAGMAMLRGLRTLRSVEAELPRRTISANLEADFFHMDSARWVGTETLSTPGCYRVNQGFTMQYLYRSDDDIRRDQAAVVTAELGKHLAARLSNKTLFAYNKKTHELHTALGADLPGLYGRAITLCAGAPSRRVRGAPSRVFTGVPVEAASILTTLMTD